MAIFKGRVQREVTKWLKKMGFSFDKKSGKPNKDKLVKIYGRYSPNKNGYKTVKVTFESNIAEVSYQIGTKGDWNRALYDFKMGSQSIQNKIEEFIPFFNDSAD